MGARLRLRWLVLARRRTDLPAAARLPARRAAGSLAGVVLEAHLQRVATTHNIKITKKAPTIADLNDPLKQDGVYETATWRKIGYLADLRNLCSHKKDVEPTAAQVVELIEGVNWAVKTIA